MIARSDLLLLGIGGGGCKLVCSIVRQSTLNFKALAVDTDAASSREAGDAAIEFLLIGRDRLLGNGTGGDVASGKVAADDDLKKLEPYLSEVRMVMVVTALGSGTGGGATPKILSFLKERGLTTLCFATMPLAFEGESRVACANAVLPVIQDFSDTLVRVALDDLVVESGIDNLQLYMEEMLHTLGAGVSLIWRMVCSAGYIQLDSERMRALVMNGKNARLGFAGSSDTPGRAVAIVNKLADHKLLLDSTGEIAPANALMVGIIGGDDLLLSEISVLMDGVNSMYSNKPRIEMGTVQDPLFNGRVEVVLFAFENWNTSSASQLRKAAANEPPVADPLPVSRGISTRQQKAKPASRLSVGPSGRGKFQNSEPTIYRGNDMDVPAYLRYGLNIEK